MVATSWYNIPGFSFQPSEFMKIIMVMYLAKITQEYNDHVLIKTTDSEIQYIIQVMKISLPPAILIYLQNDVMGYDDYYGSCFFLYYYQVV